MPTLRELLDQSLPKILKSSPGESMSGTDMIDALLKNDAVFKDYSPNALRQYFSSMAKDATSCIARVSSGYGYYLRSPARGSAADASGADDEPRGGRKNQPEEKFRALFLRLVELEERNVYGMPIEHTKGVKGAAGTNFWKYPDVVLVRWLIDFDGSSGTQAFDAHSLQLRTSLGERLFRLNSVELKVAVTIADARSMFFQCLSNSRWAHTASLVIAEGVTDERVAAELRRLGASYGVEVRSFGLPMGAIDAMPDAESIRALDPDKLAKEIVEPHVKPTILTPGEDRPELDWSYLADIRPQNDDYNILFRWLSFCISNRQPFRFGAYVEVLKG
jgi:hypothetical protein